MMVETLVVGQLQTNCYLLFDNKTPEALIIDPGDDADFIISKLSALSLKPIAILATHGHFDHILAVTELKLAYHIPFYLHQKDEFLLTRMQSSAKHFTGQTVDPPPKIDHYLNEKKLEISPPSASPWRGRGNFKLKIIHTPGHTPGSVCFYISQEKTLLSGDLIFAQGSYGRTDFAYGSERDLQQSLTKILKLPASTKIYSGHGPVSTIDDEKKHYLDLLT